MPDTLAHEVTVDCFDAQLDNGENLKDLGVGGYLELAEPTAGMHPGTWQLVEYHGEFQDQATLRWQTAEDTAAYQQAESQKFAAIFAPAASIKEI
ncbi:hypothetical protein [Streptomyces sp. NPDC047985]|uniref:hypothetical protein n=1 Tax=Streptomyces sp. NPDC047985 TaxID=3155384 RepID=UPI00343F3255